MVYPLTPPALFFWSMANLMPLAVDWPPTVQTGRSDPILIVPFDPVPPPPPPQANATNAATMRTPSPLARTIWFLHVFAGGAKKSLLANASPHSPPSSQPVSGRECAGDECGHMGWPNHYSVVNYRLVSASKSSGASDLLRRACLAWERSCINRGVRHCNQRPGRSSTGGRDPWCATRT